MKRRFLDVFGAMLSATGVAMFVPLYLDFFYNINGSYDKLRIKTYVKCTNRAVCNTNQ